MANYGIYSNEPKGGYVEYNGKYYAYKSINELAKLINKTRLTAQRIHRKNQA